MVFGFYFHSFQKEEKKILPTNTALLPQPSLEETDESPPTNQKMSMPTMKGELTGGLRGDQEGNSSLYMPTPSEVDTVNSHYLWY